MARECPSEAALLTVVHADPLAPTVGEGGRHKRLKGSLAQVVHLGGGWEPRRVPLGAQAGPAGHTDAGGPDAPTGAGWEAGGHGLDRSEPPQARYSRAADARIRQTRSLSGNELITEVRQGHY